MASFEFADGGEHFGGVDLVDFEAVANAAEERDGEFAAEMFAEFLEAAQENRLTFRIDMEKFAGEELEAEEFEQAEDARFAGAIDVAHAARINDVERDADGDGFAVAKAIFGKLLEFVRGPMTEIERTGGAEFERISGSGNVIEMEFGGAMDEALHGRGFEFAEAEGIAFDQFEEIGVANEGDFDGFDVAGAFVAGLEGFKQFEIVDDREWRREGADEILFAESVDAVFHADAGIILTQGRGGNADVTHAAMRGGRSEADHVEERAAADRDDVGMAIHVKAIDVRMNFGNVEIGILGAFAAFDNDGRADQVEFGISGEVAFDATDKEWLRLRERFVDHHDDFMARALSAFRHDVAEQIVCGGEDAFGEVHLVAITHLYGSLDARHKIFSMPDWT